MKFTNFNPVTRAERADAAEDTPSNPSGNPTIGDVIARRFNRRDVMKGALGFTAITATLGTLAHCSKAGPGLSGFDFAELEAGVGTDHAVADGYDANILIRWGDPVLANAPPFDPANQTAAAQAMQFGYNNDYVGVVPHPDAPDDPDRKLMVVNHEFTDRELMFPEAARQQRPGPGAMAAELIAIEMAAHGGTIIEIARKDGLWRTVPGANLNRRITANTEMRLSGPAAGHPLLRTSADPTGRKVLGTINNCAGGITPWGTWLMAEENFNGYFQGKPADEDEWGKARRKRYAIPGEAYDWAAAHDRFDLTKEPNEPNRFGWVVEVDPADPASTPVKRTALGRMKHEGASTTVNSDGRVVVFMGDDQRFDYIYRFVTDAAYDAGDPDPDMLDKGTLSVARFDADGTMAWLPLTHGTAGLTAEHGFETQADVLIATRLAADLLEATRMDRPEDIEANPETGKIYAMLTNNTERWLGGMNAANPRPWNPFGHIIEMTAPDGDLTADRMEWDILVKCGDPAIPFFGGTFPPSTTRSGWFGMPDNCAIDALGRLWIATDGNSHSTTGRSDGLWALGTEGEDRGRGQLFYRVPVGAELCGPYFVGEDTLLVAVQHPGSRNGGWPGADSAGTYESPATRWPDFDATVPPRPSVVAITRQGGGKIG